MTPVLAISGARKAFGQTTALDGAELTLRKGEWLGLLGPNGAGKTTLIRSVTGRVRLDEGRIELFGRAPEENAEARGRLGVVPQEIALYPLLTARENLRAFGALQGVHGRDLAERVEWALQWTALADRAREPIRTFSGGMKRRLNIACAVLHKPEIVLLDEPTVGVDPQSRQRIWEMLDQLRRDGASLLLTTHQLDEAQQICERIVIIDHGRTVAAGSFDELVAATIGRERRVTLALKSALSTPGQGLEVENNLVRSHVRDVAAELPALLTRVRAAGGDIDDVRVESPSLQAVFLHLTGRELRE